MDVPANLIDHFVTLTNAERSVASQLLGDNGLDLEAAIASFFAIQEAGGGPVPGGPPSAPSAAPSGRTEGAIDVDDDSAGVEGGVVDVDGDAAAQAVAAALAADEALARELAEQDSGGGGEEEVRAPIPEFVDQILPGGASGSRAGGPRPRRAHAVDDPFLRGDGTEHGETLAALFRPPSEINSRDDFDAAMATGQREKKWLLINIQRTGIFQCLMLNRDVWADDAVRELVGSRFIFWQRDEVSEDGKRYKQFYPYVEPPHIAVIDPRSGERLRVWGGDGSEIRKDTIVNALVDFCDAESLEYDAPDRAVSQAAARTRPASGSATGAGSSAAVDKDKDRMETEDEQIAAAIAASLQGSTAEAGSSQNGDEETANDDVEMVQGNDNAVRQASRLLSATDPGLNRDRSLRAQQDSEFEQSLAVDRAKVESAKAEADRVDRAAKEEAERAEREANLVEEKRARIPAPPPEDCTDSTTTLMVRLPSGKRLQRRFYCSNTIGNVYDFVDVEGSNELEGGSYNLIVPFPRASFSDRSVTLQDASLSGRAALNVDRLYLGNW